MAEHRLRDGSNLIQNGVLPDHQSLLEGHVIRYLPGFEYRPRVLGTPVPKSLVIWVSPSNMAAVFSVSPGTLPGYPEP